MPRASTAPGSYALHGSLPAPPRHAPAAAKAPYDAVALEEAAPAAAAKPAGALASLKALFILFLLFLLVVSDTFVSSVLAGFGEKAVEGRTPTAWGTVLQGTLLVILFALSGYLMQHGVL